MLILLLQTLFSWCISSSFIPSKNNAMLSLKLVDEEVKTTILCCKSNFFLKKIKKLCQSLIRLMMGRLSPSMTGNDGSPHTVECGI